MIQPLSMIIALIGVPPTDAIANVLPAYSLPTGGGLITISGTFSGPALAVSFGSIAATTISSAGSSTIYASIPPLAPGQYPITIVTAAGPTTASPGGALLVATNTDQTLSTGYGTANRAATLNAINSAQSSIVMSTWQLSDPLVVSALASAALNGVHVQIAEDLENRSGGEPCLACQIIASGGTVMNTPVPRKIQNNFLAVDGGTLQFGNYYQSDTAAQIGNYLTTTAGTTGPANAAAQYANLALAGSMFQSCSACGAFAPAPAGGFGPYTAIAPGGPAFPGQMGSSSPGAYGALNVSAKSAAGDDYTTRFAGFAPGQTLTLYSWSGSVWQNAGSTVIDTVVPVLSPPYSYLKNSAGPNAFPDVSTAGPTYWGFTLH